MIKPIRPQQTFRVKQKHHIKRDTSANISWEELLKHRSELPHVPDSELSFSVEAEAYNYCDEADVDFYFMWDEEKPNTQYKKEMKEFQHRTEIYDAWKLQEIERLLRAKQTRLEQAQNRIKREQEKLDFKLAELKKEEIDV